jgi:hypothetical protein
MDRLPPHRFQRIARVVYGIACLGLLTWSLRFAPFTWQAVLLCGWLIVYAGGLALTVVRLRPHAETKRTFRWHFVPMLIHALAGATASVDLALHGRDVNHRTMIAGMCAMFFGSVPALVLHLAARHATGFLLANFWGTGFFLVLGAVF